MADTEAAPLSSVQINAVQESWKIIVANSKENGVTLIKRMLTEHPEILHLFSFGRCGLSGEAIFQQPMFHRHCQYVMESLDAAVNGLIDLTALVPVLEKLGEKHKSFQVKREHFQYLQEAFVFMLQKALGDDLTKNLAESWLAVYAVMVDTMASKM
ncbi:neuroglobin-like [Patiria miniata]|uniref:Globin domain-containing protein n=1 Tax=Patiria miniata TaxID=46514 RepID=A0A914BJ51_PATMI|nr:neuroglobin-like [Patiria miniata]